MLLEGKKFGWVGRFQMALFQSLTGFLGYQPNIFWDKNKIEGYQKITEEIKAALENTTLFVPILSPNLLNSTSCKEELDYFYEQRMAQLNSGSQIFPVSKILIDALPEKIKDILVKYEFYETDGAGENIQFYDPELGSDLENKFHQKIYDLAYKISLYIKKNSPTGLLAIDRPVKPLRRIYLAEPSPDLWEEYENIRRDLEQRGNSFIPLDLKKESVKPDSADDYRKLVDKDLKSCDLTVNLIGKRSNGFPELSKPTYQQIQMEVAAKRDDEPDFKRLVWVPQDLEIDSERQKNLIDEVRNSRSRNVEFIQSSLESFKTRIQEALVLPPPDGSGHLVPGKSKDDEIPPCVYVLYDKSDLESVRPVEDKVQDENCVVFPSGAYYKEDPEINVFTEHMEWLSKCDSVVIYWNFAPRSFVLNKLLDLFKAKARRKSRNVAENAIYVDGDMNSNGKDRFNPPPALSILRSLSELEDFLSRLEVQFP
jgi:hypothetical protein